MKMFQQDLNTKGKDIYQTYTDSSSISNEIETERSYLIRLKTQRQKLENLYIKYDELLNELTNKNQRIKQMNQMINQLKEQCKNTINFKEKYRTIQIQYKQLLQSNQQLQNLKFQKESQYENLSNYLQSKQLININKLQMQNIREKIIELHNKLNEKEIYCEQLENKILKLEEQTQKYKQNKIINNSRITQYNEEIDILKVQNNILVKKVKQIEKLMIENKKSLQKHYEFIINDQMQEIVKLNNNFNRSIFEIDVQAQILQKLNIKYQKLQNQQKKMKDKQNQLTKQILKIKQQYTDLQKKIIIDQNLFEKDKLDYQNKIIVLEDQLKQSERKEKEMMNLIWREKTKEKQKQMFRNIQHQELEKITLLLKKY